MTDPRPLLALGVLGGTVWVGLFDPHDPRVPMPICPWHALTGLYCPGCGGLRAVHDLLHGDVRAALRDNAFLLAAVPVLAVVGWRRLTGRQIVVPRWLGSAVLIAAIGWTVVRNLPRFRWKPTSWTG